MSFSIELPQSYTFSLCIDQGNRTLVDTTVEVQATSEGIAKAKRTIQQLMNEYAPAIEPTHAPAPKPENQVPIDPADQLEAAPTPPLEKKPDGARGLLRLHCSECGSTFGTFLREYQTEMDCKCGHHIDLTAPLAKFAYTCPYCEQTRWGQTNLEDPEITIRCKCGGDVNLRWVPKSREYQN